jgi:hypothetical protein
MTYSHEADRLAAEAEMLAILEASASASAEMLLTLDQQMVGPDWPSADDLEAMLAAAGILEVEIAGGHISLLLTYGGPTVVATIQADDWSLWSVSADWSHHHVGARVDASLLASSIRLLASQMTGQHVSVSEVTA